VGSISGGLIRGNTTGLFLFLTGAGGGGGMGASSSSISSSIGVGFVTRGTLAFRGVGGSTSGLALFFAPGGLPRPRFVGSSGSMTLESLDSEGAGGSTGGSTGRSAGGASTGTRIISGVMTFLIRAIFFIGRWSTENSRSDHVNLRLGPGSLSA
jgi:hypothetical protein